MILWFYDSSSEPGSGMLPRSAVRDGVTVPHWRCTEVGCLPCSWSSVFVTFNTRASVTCSHTGAISKTTGALCRARCQLAGRGLAAAGCVPALGNFRRFHFYSTERTPWPPALGSSSYERRDAAKRLLDEPFGRAGRIWGGVIILKQKCHAFIFFSPPSLEQKLPSWQSSTLSEAFWCRTTSSRAWWWRSWRSGESSTGCSTVSALPACPLGGKIPAPFKALFCCSWDEQQWVRQSCCSRWRGSRVPSAVVRRWRWPGSRQVPVAALETASRLSQST